MPDDDLDELLRRQAGVVTSWDEVAHRPQLVITRVLRAVERASHRRAS